LGVIIYRFFLFLYMILAASPGGTEQFRMQIQHVD
jgi:hypothetical protein